MVTSASFSNPKRFLRIIPSHFIHQLVLALAALLLGEISLCPAQEIEPSSPPTFAEEQEFISAQTLYRDSCYQLAGDRLASFVLKHPHSIQNAEAVFMRAECLFNTSQYQLAAITYADFATMYPVSHFLPEAYFRLGQIDFLLNKPDEAIASLKIVLDDYGDSEVAGEAAYWIGESYLGLDDSQNAIKYYTLAYENYPRSQLRAEAIYSIARTYEKRSEFSQASEWFEKLKKEYPQSPLHAETGLGIGRSYFFAGDYSRSLDEFLHLRQNVRDSDEASEADYFIAEAYFKLGKQDEAQRRYERFLADYPEHRLAPEVQYDLGWIYLTQSNYPKSIECFDALARRSDDLGEAALYQRSVAERRSGNKSAAFKSLREITARNSQDKWNLYSLYDAGILLFDEGKTTEAESDFRRITVECGTCDISADGFLMLGECLLKRGEYQDAQSCFDEASTSPVASFDTKLRACYQSAVCLRKMGKLKEAETKFGRFATAYPKHPIAVEARYAQAEIEYASGDYAASLAAYQEIASSGEAKREESIYGAAWSMYNLGFYARAIEAFEKLIAVYPESKLARDSRLRIADAFFSLKDYGKAIGSYRSVIRLFPGEASIDYAYYRLGLSYLMSDDKSGAFDAFSEFIRTVPKSPMADEAQFALGWINFRQKEFNEATKEFEKFLKEYPHSDLVPHAQCLLGDCFYQTKRYDAAEQSYLAVVTQFPQNPYSRSAASGIQNCLQARRTKRHTIRAAVDESSDHVPIPEQAQAQPKKLLQEEPVISEGNFQRAPLVRSSRDRETAEILIKNRSTAYVPDGSKYSGLFQAGLGSFFTPAARFQYGQVFPGFHYTLDGDYHLTKGFISYTDQSGGRFSATGGTTLQSSSSVLQNAVADGRVNFESESYHFYGSVRPDFWRDVKDFQLQTTLVNHSTARVPYSASISLRNLDIQDTSTLASETRLGFHGTANFTLSSLPARAEMDVVTASGGLWFSHLSAGIRYRWLNEMAAQASLHFYWASGMAGQTLLRLRPHISVSYQLYVRHKVYIAYEPSIVPMTLAEFFSQNRFLRSTAVLRHKDITDSGELGIESEWTEALQTRCILNVQSLRDDAFFSPKLLQPGWDLMYGGRTTIVTARAEMVAKLSLNDYFGSSLLLRSAKDSFLGERIPYIPSIEAGCYARHRLGSIATIAAHIRIVGSRYGDASGSDKIPAFMVIDVTGDYAPADFLSLSAAILNLTDAKYSVWQGYREFPLTARIALQIRW